MAIFRIPEIIILIGPYLSTLGLVHFCLVNKTWNAVLTPHLWRSLPFEPASPPFDPLIRLDWTWKRFLPLIEADILYEQRHYHPEGHSNYSNDNSSNNFSLPADLRNGRWIRSLEVYQLALLRPYHPHPYQVISMSSLESTSATTTTAAEINSSKVQRHRHQTNHNPKFTTIELLLHLLKRCPNLQTINLRGQDKTSTEYYFWKRIMTTGFPASIKNLQIQLCSSVSLANSTLLSLLFARCSSGVEKLSLDFDFDDTLWTYWTSSIDTETTRWMSGPCQH